MFRRLALNFLGALVLIPGAVLAQSESYLLGPGSNVGPDSTLKTVNCLTNPDGSTTCDTRIQNPAGDTQAKPQINYFNN
ncbi:MAG: hypothetical protein EBT85_02220 [Synechococcaceae bacterium WB5_2B_268]|nr:hypothetical protein [Synechococcaceae bacterium WB5_2B_268]